MHPSIDNPPRVTIFLFFFPPLRLKFRSSTRRSPLCRTIEKQSSSAQQRIPSLFLWRLKFQPATYNACEFFFSRIQIHVPPIDRNISTIMVSFFFRDETGRYECKRKQACRRPSPVPRTASPECDERVLFLDFWGSGMRHFSRKRSRNTRRRTSHQEFALHETRFLFFFFLSFSLRKKKKKEISRIQSCPDFDALWYYDRSTCHLRSLSQRFLSPDQIN